MKKIESIIRTERLPMVKEALKKLEIGGMTVYSVTGWSKGKEEYLQWKGESIVHDLIAKSKIEIIAADENVDDIIKTIAKHAKTGAHGDGIIIVTPVEQSLTIFTIETNGASKQ